MKLRLIRILEDKGDAIMFHATPEDIARRRRELNKWREDELAALPLQVQLVAAIHGTGKPVQKIVAADALTKAQKRADELLEKYGAPSLPLEIELLDRIAIEISYLDRRAELDRLERRSEAHRFAVAAAPVRPELH